MRATAFAFLCAMVCTETTHAASGAAEDSAGVFIWIFIGMVGLILAVLLVPTARSIRRLVADTEKQADTVEERLGPGK